MRAVALKLTLFLSFCFFLSNSFAFKTQFNLPSRHLAKQAIIVEDAEHGLSVEDVLFNRFRNEQSQQVEINRPYLDFTTSTYWLRLQIDGDSLGTEPFYLETARPLTNRVNLYVYNAEDELIYISETGDDFPFFTRPFRHYKFFFPLKLSKSDHYKIIVKATSDGEILKLPLKYWRIEDLTAFIGLENFFLGLYYGLFILVIVLFSFFGIALRQRLYLLFVIYVFVLGIFQLSLDGIAFQYFWPHSPWLGNHAILITAAVSMLLMLIYVRYFIDFSIQPNYYRKGYYFFIAFISICLIFTFTSGTIYSLLFPILNGISFLAVLYILLGIYNRSRLGKKTEYALLGAFLFLCVGAILFITSNVNILPSEFLASNALKIGSAGEVTFLSLALAGRYRQTQQEKLEAQEIANTRLQEVNELKEAQTEKLEKEVAERTSEIRDKNAILSEKNREIINSINYAQRLQTAILPSRSLFEDAFKDSMVLFKPKDIVSGDFYWMEETDDQVFFAVADCTGHGVPGAMVSVLGYNSLNRCINEFELRDAGKILDTLTDLVEKTFNKYSSNVSDGMDIALCVWDKKNKLQYAGANNALYLLRDGEIIETKADKQPIGKFLNRQAFTTHHINLKKGDSVYLFSDGYADQFGGEKGKKLKTGNFKKIILSLNSKPSDHIKQGLNDFFEEWKGLEEQIDDVCVMNVKF